MDITENTPLKPHSNTLANVSEKDQHQWANVLTLIFLAPAIASLVIASEYNPSTSVCEKSNDNDDISYIINLRDWLIYAGCINLGHFILHTCSAICNACKCSSHVSGGGVSGFGCLILLFDFVWSIIGLIMYNQQMSNLCHETDVAKMILSWCIIKLSLIGLGCCCLTCLLCTRTNSVPSVDVSTRHQQQDKVIRV